MTNLSRDNPQAPFKWSELLLYKTAHVKSFLWALADSLQLWSALEQGFLISVLPKLHPFGDLVKSMNSFLDA